MADLPKRFSESQISHVLERAAEIDAAGTSVSVEELRSIAAEAGIDPEATEHAIHELFGDDPGLGPATAGSPPSLVKATASPSAGRIMAGGGIGFAAGLTAGLDVFLPYDPWMGPNLFALGGFAGAIGYLFWRLVQSMKSGGQLDFQLQNLALCFGLAAGVTVSYPILADDGIGIALATWLVAALVGGMLIRFGQREGEDGGPAPMAQLAEPDARVE